ncbi:acetyl-CoA synthetase-like protein [Periconia macrospinosa]|uniref:Acetyl-CoA synthetase-like protein n=1 Tax=Periconia macrospinosa TaxID=97972 RepID=A0A2V1DG71_9PLEO|nr:acetyl-CoA synthetase-like protein [Periconia macrospinosa]
MDAATKLGVAQVDDTLCAWTKAMERGDVLRSVISADPELSPNVVEGIYPCTARQEWILSITKAKPEACVSRRLYQLPSCIDMGRFQAAWHLIAEVNASLRTRLVQSDRGVFQVVVKGTPEIRMYEAMDTYQAAEMPGLSCPSVRLAMIKAAARSEPATFALAVHHALLDCFSLPSLLAAVEAAYSGQGTQPVRNDLPAPSVTSDEPTVSREFWKHQLRGLEAAAFPATLVISNPPSSTRGFHEYVMDVPYQRETGFKLSTFVQLAWGVVIGHYTNSGDVMYGLSMPAAAKNINSRHPAAQTIVTIPLRLQISRDQTIRECLTAMDAAAEARIPHEQFALMEVRSLGGAHETCGFTSHLTLLCQLEDPLSQSVLFNHCIGEHKEILPACGLDLQFTSALDKKRSRITFSHDEAVVDEEAIRRLARQFEHVLQQVCRNTNQLVADVEVFSPRDQSELERWNSVFPEVNDVCIHELMLNNGKSHAEATAISSWDGTLSYEELDRLSSTVARYLVGCGVDLSTTVLLVFEKSKWMAVAVLAVLRAGGVCVPLDPSQPDGRIQAIAQDTRASFALTSPANKHRLKEVENVVELCQDLLDCLCTPPDTKLPRVSPSDVAFVFYTSGSTGKPKGVVMEHRSTATGMRNVNGNMGVIPGIRVLHFASYAFDASIHEMLNALVTGGCLCIPHDSQRDDLAGFIRRERVTWAILTPSIVAQLSPGDVPSLQTLVTTGEAMARSDIDTWSQSLTLINAFGPTETAFCCAVERVDPVRRAPGSVGHVVNGLGWITTPADPSQLAAIGAVGELLIEGPALAREYLHDRQATEAAFIPAPPWRRRFPGSACRLYRTGDLVQYRSDSSLQFIGRRDTQVKIRGQRIELSEVEHHVQQSAGAGIAAAVEAVKPLGSNAPVLVAFLAIKKNAANGSPDLAAARAQQLCASGLQEKLAQSLPPSMVPAAFLPVEQLPLTATGKLNRRRLREMVTSRTMSQLNALQPGHGPFRAPSTDMEHQLLALWQRILGIDVSGISADDSFFKIGGDSISVLRLVGEARKTGLSLSAADVFRAPHLCDLAGLLTAAGSKEGPIAPFSVLAPGVDKTYARGQAASLCGLASSADVADVFPCTPLQEGLLALTTKWPGTYMSQRVLKLKGHVDIQRFQGAWERVVLVTPILRTRIVDLHKQGLVQVVIDAQVDWTTGQDLDSILKIQKETVSMGLGTPLTAFALVDDCIKGKRYFVWTKHHAIYDGWSVPLILEQVTRVYQGRELDVPVPFQRYIKYAMQPSDDAREYWRRQLQGSEAAPFPAVSAAKAQPRADDIFQRQVSSLNWPRDSDITASAVVRAAWAILTAQYTGLSDVIFGVTVTGRNAPVPGIERIAAPTISTVPIRVVIDWQKSIRSLLQKIAQQAVEMIPFEHVGLQQIRKINEDVERSSQFQSLIIVQPKSSLGSTDVYEGDVFQQNDDNDWVIEELKGSPYAITLECQLESSGARLQMSYDAQIIEHEQVRRLARQLEHILRLLCIEENQDVPAQDVMTANSEDLSDIWAWNETVPEAVETTVPDLLGEWAQIQPLAPAVCASDGELTYGQLDLLSTRLARYIIEHRVGRGDLVPLCFHKSVWMPVAMLSVVKAGGATVAMDISQPKDRLRSIVQQTQPTIILSSNDSQTLAASLTNAAVVPVGAELFERAETEVRGHPLPVVRASDKLFVAFTSGSTGRPKGAVITHRNVVTAIHYQQSTLGLDPGARLFDFASYSFDVASLNCYYAFSTGACLCIPSESSRKNDIAASMRQLAVTTACLTPSTARLIEPVAVPNLRTLALAGEPVKTHDVLQWGSHLDLKNVYGPAECVTSTAWDVNQRLDQAGNIGRGLGLVTWVVTLSGNCLAPIGAVGELWLEGPLVGDGYLGEPEKTKASFVENPAWLLRGGRRFQRGRPGRLYRTGDLVKYNQDGVLVFIGRKDDQVKIRGQRVELDEIEHHLSRAVSVPVVVDVIKPQGSDNSILVGFLDIGEDAYRPPAEARAVMRKVTDGARELLANQLPSYMIPGFYIPINRVPLSMTGKTNRRLLREMGEILTLELLANLQPARDTDGDDVPQTEMELQLQGLWASVLGLKASIIGRSDNFLQIGGDSVAAMRLVAAARNQGLSFTVDDLFRKQVLCELAGVVKKQGPGDRREQIPAFSLFPPTAVLSDVITQAASQCAVSDAQVEDIYPCTPLQEGLLSITMKKPEEYIDRGIYRLGWHVDVARFRAAWEEVVRIMVLVLRTRIVYLPGFGLMQVVVAEDVRWATSTDLHKFLDQDKQKTMGLGTALSRVALVTDVNSGERFFIWTRHHSIYDGWFVPLVLEQVEKIYQGHAGEVLTPFNHFVKHITHLSGEAIQYWEDQLRGLEAATFPALLSGHEPDADENMRYRISHIRWPRNDITPATIFRAAWAILTAQYTNSSDVIFGVTLSGRTTPVPGIECVAGPTIATVPVRIILDWEGTTVYEMLQQVQRQAVDMACFEQIGLQQIEMIGREIGYDAGQGSLFQTLLVVQPASPRTASPSTERLLQPVGSENNDMKAAEMNSFNPYAMMMECQLEADGVDLQLSFDSCVIGPKQVRRVLRQLEHVLHEMCSGQDKLLQDVKTANKEDLDDIWEWNHTVPDAVQACVHDVIAQQVSRSPDSPAICAWDGDLTYRELDGLSTRLAYRLVELGTRNTIVPLCFEKSMWMPVAMLGVMKAGGASLAMDVNQPEERLRRITKQAHSTIILTSTASQELAARLGIQTQVTVDRLSLQKLDTVPHRSLPSVEPTSRLYVVFTSGSTGKPKGAVITHSNFSSAIRHQQDALGFNSNARVFDFSSYSFDAAWSNFLHTVSSGGCLCIPSELDRKDNLAASMAQMRVTYADLTPSAARLIDPGVTETLRLLVLAGEPMSHGDIATWASRLTLMNTYGPAECSVTSTASGKLDPTEKEQNIGRGVGLVTWVVEPSGHNNPIPIGAIGELWIEGPLVGQGYLGDLAKTEASFVQNPAWLLRGGANRPGRQGRLYRTGDLVKYTSDGTLLFVGRKDDGQVKIRGQRVELGEVEHYIRQFFSGVRDVVADVIVPRGEEQGPLLVAFICSENTSNGDCAVQDSILSPHNDLFRSLATTTEAQLSDVLPSYMVPAVYIPVQRIPTLGSGKTDRRQLRELGRSLTRQDLGSYSYELRATKRQPSTDVERVIQALYAQVLNTEPSAIGTDDSFFKLGGDSISAMQLSAKCRSAGLQVTVSHIFQRKTITHIARDATKAAGNSLSNVKEQLEVPFALSPIQQFFFETQSSGHNHFYQSFLLGITRTVSSSAMVQALEAVVSRHSMLRSRFRRATDGGWFQLITAGVGNSFRYRLQELDSLLEAANAVNDTKESLDIQSGPLLAADLINTRAEGQYLFLVIHHLVVDLMSWRVILEDLEEFLTKGTLTTLCSSSFQAWCRMQAQYSSEHLSAEMALPVIVPAQPRDYWGSSAWEMNTYGDTRQSRFRLDDYTSGALLGLANEAFRTEPVEIFQAVILHSFTNTFLDHPAPVIFNEGHGREPWDDAVDVSRTVGWFTTMWPLHVPVGVRRAFTEVLRRTKDLRRKTPKRGWAYFAARYLNSSGRSAFGAHDHVELLFNFEGSYQQLERGDSLFRHQDSALNNQLSGEMKQLNRSALIEVTLSMSRGSLEVVFYLNKHMEHQSLLDDWVARCKRDFETAAVQLVRLDTSYTLSDFPTLDLSYDGLDRVVNQSLLRAGISLPEIEEAFRCTPTQLLMLRAQSVQPELYATAFTGAVRTGQGAQVVSLEKLIDVWQALVDRHQSLRTVFVPTEHQKEWVQVVLKRVQAPVLRASCQHDNALETLSAQQPLHCQGKDPPHRMIFCQTSTGEIFFKLETSHAIMDAMSRSVLFEEWSLMCMDRPLEGTAPLYSTYVSHIHSVSDPASKYWIEYLRSIRPCFFPVTANQDGDRGNLASVEVEFDAPGALRELSQRYGFTLPTLIKAAWALVLYGSLGQTSVCFGYFDSGRHVPIAGIDEMVGALMNILVCTVRLDKDAPLRAVLEALQNDYYQALPHHPYALYAADACKLEQQSSRLFNTLINYRREPSSAISKSTEICFDFIEGKDPMEFDIVLSIDDLNNAMHLKIDFWEGRVPRSVALQSSLSLRATLMRLLNDVDQCISAT